MAKEKLIPLSKISSKKMDSIEQSKGLGDKRAFEVLFEAQRYWQGMEKFRRDRERNKRYTYGDQWKDMVTVDGEKMTEEQYIMKQGSIPLKNNLIRRLVRNVLGVFRGQSKEPTCTARDRDEQKLGETMSTVLQYVMQQNRAKEVYARSMEEFLISGLIVHRKWFGWRNNKLDCWTDYVDPDKFFIDNNMRDFRGWDVSCLGEIHDISFQTLCTKFAKAPGDYDRLARIYQSAVDRSFMGGYYKEFGFSDNGRFDFMVPDDPTMCRVIEVWRKETKSRYLCHDYNNGDIFKVDIEDYNKMVKSVNDERLKMGLESGMAREDIPLIKAKWFIDEYWYYYLLSPLGDILEEGETPYEHKSHPYVFKAYPFIDGEIHSFVSDVIDQQRYTNRLITMYDFIMRASAKGLLIFPEECLPEGMSMDDIADEWSRFNGVIVFKASKTEKVPTQIANNCTNIGIHELLNLQLKFFEDISGVNGALQGKPGYAGTSGNLYAQQTQNATTSLLDILESFSDFVIDAAYVDVKNIQQYYDTKRVINIAGKNGVQFEDDPEKIHDVEIDLSIAESTSTPAYRQMQNDFLMEIWRGKQISLEQLLENGDFPFADQLLQSIKSQQEQLQQGNIPDALPENVIQQVQQGANMGNVNKAYRMLTDQPAA